MYYGGNIYYHGSSNNNVSNQGYNGCSLAKTVDAIINGRNTINDYNPLKRETSCIHGWYDYYDELWYGEGDDE